MNNNYPNNHNSNPYEDDNSKKPRKDKLTLSSTNKMIAGVCGGFSEYFHVDATIIRILVVALALITAIFPVVIFYIACWAIMPLESDI